MNRTHRIQTELLILIADKVGVAAEDIERAVNPDYYFSREPTPAPASQGLAALFDTPAPAARPAKRGPYKKRAKP